MDAMTTLTFQEKVRVLASASRFDTCNTSGICRSFGPDGRCISLYKTLISNSCSGECTYCPNRCERDTTRASLTKAEIKNIAWGLYRANAIEGLFLSSGIRGNVDAVTEFQIEVAKELRAEGFRGYLHIRLMPGVNKDDIMEISKYADKFGVNVESVDRLHYSELCPNFDYGIDAVRRMRYTEDAIKKERKRGHIVGGNDTQFVVGAAGETDWEYLKTCGNFMEKFSLRKPFFMSFSPVKKTPLEKEPGSPRWREHRLYQSWFLLKQYGYRVREFKDVLENENLQNCDPKVLMAQDMCVDVNSAKEDELLRVPGIGPLSAYRISHYNGQIRSYGELKGLGVVLKRAAPYLEVGNQKQEKLSKWLMS